MASSTSPVDGGLTFRDSSGADVRATLLHLSREGVVFEVYGPEPVVKSGESLPDLTIYRTGRPMYRGGAVVASVMSTGRTLIVTATLLGTWIESQDPEPGGRVTSNALDLIQGWDAGVALDQAYQVAVANIRSFLLRLSRRVAPIDLSAAAGNGSTPLLLANMAEELYSLIEPRLARLFAQYEEAWHRLPADSEVQQAHRAFAQEELHPLLLCSPFLHRVYTKPLGYAGDYRMVEMILRNQMEGPNTYARIVNAFFLRTDLAHGHRNRVAELVDTLRREAFVSASRGRPLRVLNTGCGPAHEICAFVESEALADRCEFTLLDFNRETIDYARQRIEAAARASGRNPKLEFVHKSVNELLKEAAGRRNEQEAGRYDLVYCAGLFDYLSDRVCSRLLALFYEWVREGGLVVTTNVAPSHTVHGVMEHLVEWHLILRNSQQMLALLPPGQNGSVRIEPAGVNVFLETRKPVESNASANRTDRCFVAG